MTELKSEKGKMMRKQRISGHTPLSGGVKVLLCEDVNELGWLGDVVEVNAGYARNYLLPQGLAKPAIEANLRAIAKEKTRRAEQRITQRKRLEEAAGAQSAAQVGQDRVACLLPVRDAPEEHLVVQRQVVADGRGATHGDGLQGRRHVS